jgi:hypothetical protein
MEVRDWLPVDWAARGVAVIWVVTAVPLGAPSGTAVLISDRSAAFGNAREEIVAGCECPLPANSPPPAATTAERSSGGLPRRQLPWSGGL